jgi:hypothetical protein
MPRPPTLYERLGGVIGHELKAGRTVVHNRVDFEYRKTAVTAESSTPLLNIKGLSGA